MPKINAFRGLRYNVSKVGSLSNVVIPPPAALSHEYRNERMNSHSENLLHAISLKAAIGTNAASSGGPRLSGAKLVKQWKQDGILQKEVKPAIYVYHQVSQVNGDTTTRRGFLCLTALSDFDPIRFQRIEPSRVEENRKVRHHVKADICPVTFLYSDHDDRHQNKLESAIADATPIEVRTEDQTIHRLWPVTDLIAISELQNSIANEQVLVAQGKHRFAAAHADLQEGQPNQSGSGSSQILSFYTSEQHIDSNMIPGIVAYETEQPLDLKQLNDRLPEDDVECSVLDGATVQDVFDTIQIEGDRNLVGLYAAADQAWVLVKWNDPRLWHEQRNQTIGKLTGFEAGRLWECQKRFGRAEMLMDYLRSTDGRCGLAAVTLNPSVSLLKQLANQGQALEVDCTYFPPEPICGFVMHSHY